MPQIRPLILISYPLNQHHPDAIV